MDTAQWPQGIGVVKPVDQSSIRPAVSITEKKPRPQKEHALNCPRCNSTNTKFCYYNNYSLSQPRYFCKTCRRYWTQGGTLRSVPVGGGCRKNKRSSSSSSSANSINNNNNNNNNNPCSISAKPDLSTPTNFSSPQNPKFIHEGGHDLNLAYIPASSSHYNTSINGMAEFPEFVGRLPFGLDHHNHTRNLIKYPQNLNNPSDDHNNLPVMEFLKSAAGTVGSSIATTGLMSSSFLSSHVPISDSSTVLFSSSSGFNHDPYKPSLGFCLDDQNNNNTNMYGNMQEVEASSRTLFPFEELKPLSINNNGFDDHQHEQDRASQAAETNGYWNGMLGSW